ncbi:DUF1824 family protein [Leptolyngbya cf. ectocarpi LEGE 11479]|uniref:DUF1824 family protein n=1 Tax=Leptolyngbya cf. ectocarpi LEGE 11479 TaxID=1828722 RepID=A0A928ZXM1_LEPEC|nr:DUF1824 family protein [Leptolyngbya ectocarpi]MBE9069377.1 DUF1824 family protein [Leptolyngbya cf. ectocarpi LEGE 11479]
MPHLQPIPANIKKVRQQLGQFSCLVAPPQLAAAQKKDVINALLWFSDLADYETLGICTDTLAAGITATEAYVGKLARPITLDLPPRDGPVYIKFNTLKGAWYLDDYVGPNRGVLVSFHASEPEYELVNGTYGPFPLDLFD